MPSDSPLRRIPCGNGRISLAVGRRFPEFRGVITRSAPISSHTVGDPPVQASSRDWSIVAALVVGLTSLALIFLLLWI